MSFLPLIGTILGGLVAAFTPQIQDFVAAHPAITAIVGTVIASIAHFLPSPTAPKA